ncbi:MAG: site-specific integrase [Clostridia bacterium]|nr:site-specific integrase [Clostridia bacterium]
MPKKSNSRASQGSGTIRQRKDGTWEARYTLGRDPGTGKQIQKSIYGKTEAEVRKKLTSTLHQIDDGMYIEPIKMTVGQWLDEWLLTYKADLTEGTRTKYRADIETNIKPYLGSVKLQALNAHQIQKMLNGLKTNHSRKSLVCVKSVLHTALQQAFINGFIAYNPCDKVTVPKGENAKKEINPLTQKQIDDFLAACRGSEYENLFRVALFTGMREGEIMGLQWRNIDFENGVITIDHQLKRTKSAEYYFDETKTHEIRKIKPAPAVMKILSQQKKLQAERRLRAGDLWNEGDFPGLVFTNEFGKHYGKNTMLHNVQKLAERIGVHGFRFHDLRHTFAVSSILAGDDIYTISKTLGHSNIKITLDTYSHYTDDLRNKASLNMEAFMQGLANL